MKICTKCNGEKSLDNFNKRQSRCKPCQLKYANEWRINNPNNHKSSVSKYLTTDKGKQTYKINLKKHYYSKQGVYGIFSDENCLYVGESKRLNGRINDHKYWIRYPHKSMNQDELYTSIANHSNIEIRILEECDNHKKREGYWINKLNPKYNGN